MPTLHQCLNTGCTNTVHYKKAKFCSYKCSTEYFRNPANRAVHKHTCKFCGTQFQSNKPSSFYCSPKCRSTAQRIKDNSRPPRKRSNPKPGRDNGIAFGIYEAMSEKVLHHEHTRNETIQQSREAFHQPHQEIQISPRTWVVARPGADTDKVREHVKGNLEKHKAAF